METDSIKACYLAYCVPRPLKVRARLSCFSAGYNVGLPSIRGRVDRIAAAAAER
jgi:hypothetical protein